MLTILTKVKSTLLLLFTCCNLVESEYEFVSSRGPICDVERFPVPYIRVSKRRSGKPMEEIKKTGFIDMTKYLHVTVCLNGPVVMYSAYEDINLTEGRTIYKGASVDIYQHSCMVVNQIPSQIIWDLRRNQSLPFRKLNLRDIPQESLIGRTVTGLQLIAQLGDYYKRTAKFFPADKYSHISKNREGVAAISFVTVGEGPFCLKINNTVDVVLGGQPKKASVCKWTFPDDLGVSEKFRTRYNRIFDGQYFQNYFHWFDCSLLQGLNPFPISELPPPAPPVIHDPFATYDPSSLIPPKQDPGNTFSEFDFMDDDFDSEKFSATFTNLGYMGEESDEDYDSENPNEFPIVLSGSNCEALMPKPEVAPEGCPKKDKNAGCNLLQLAMNITPDGTLPDEIYLTGEIGWKQEILNTIADIFSRICLPFPREMSFNMARLFAYYLTRAHNADFDLLTEERGMWTFLKSELAYCKKRIVQSKEAFKWHWFIQQNEAEFPNPPTTEEEEYFNNLTMDHTCLTSECTFDCIPEGDTCYPANEATEYCANLKGENCTVAPQCYYNPEYGSCEPVMNCEALDCYHADPRTICETHRDKCIAKNGGRDDDNIDRNLFNPEDFGVADESIFSSPLGAIWYEAPAVYSPMYKAALYVDEQSRNRADYRFNAYPERLFVISNVKMKNQASKSSTRKLEDVSHLEGQCLFFFEEAAETDHDLNVAIDAFWKIASTVFGYCNKHHAERKQETYSRMFNMFVEDFLVPLYSEWAFPTDNEELKIILRDINSERSSRWLDTCLETAYIVSDSLPFRTPRPLPVGFEGSLQSNYFTK